MIMCCVKTMKYAIHFKFDPTRFFSMGIGLRQGDPLSVYLFILVVEVLGRSLSIINDGKTLKDIKVAPTLPSSTYQQFVDNTVMFGVAQKREVERWKMFLNDYVII